MGWVEAMNRLATIAAGIALLSLASAAHSQPRQDAGTTIANLYFGTMPQEVYMAKITVSDIVRSYDFYTRVLGMKLVTSKVMPMAGAPSAADNDKQFLEVSLNFTGSLREPMLILIKQKGVTPVPAQAAQTWLAFKVADGKAVMDAGAKAGYPPFRPWQPARKMGFLKDPDGYTVEVLQLPSYP
jgi:catechol 2,3-dioxygenase-like lactoylglutathione lyase family enzyme